MARQKKENKYENKENTVQKKTSRQNVKRGNARILSAKKSMKPKPKTTKKTAQPAPPKPKQTVKKSARKSAERKKIWTKFLNFSSNAPNIPFSGIKSMRKIAPNKCKTPRKRKKTGRK